jgi:hypothetical protein
MAKTELDNKKTFTYLGIFSELDKFDLLNHIPGFHDVAQDSKNSPEAQSRRDRHRGREKVDTK